MCCVVLLGQIWPAGQSLTPMLLSFLWRQTPFLSRVREDLGFRWVSEQVSHHPPVSAFQAEGLKDDFIFHGSVYPKLKFWGKSIEAEPKGIITLELPRLAAHSAGCRASFMSFLPSPPPVNWSLFHRYNEAYTWTNPTCCVHNIIVGQLWIEQYGSVEVINHK